MRSGLAYPCASYRPAVQAGPQPPVMHQMGDMPSHNANETSPFGRLPNLLNGTQRVEKNVDKLSLAEEGLKDEDSEGSEQERSQEYTFCGMDFKPALPAALAISTMLGGVCMFLVQIPMLARFTVLPQLALSAGFAAVFVSTLVCMACSYFADPGQVKEPHKEALPLRAHKSWQYPLPIRCMITTASGWTTSSASSITESLFSWKRSGAVASVLRVNRNEARVLSSKARAPYMVLMEVEDKPLAEEKTARRGFFGRLCTSRKSPVQATHHFAAVPPKFWPPEDSPPASARNARDSRPKGAFHDETWSEVVQRVRSQSEFGRRPNWSMIPMIVKSNADDVRQEELAFRLLKWFERVFKRHSAGSGRHRRVFFLSLEVMRSCG
eukprot:Skav202919  [mRNA]  locus=scaffold1565:157028:162480:- [translate_table: standard]